MCNLHTPTVHCWIHQDTTTFNFDFDFDFDFEISRDHILSSMKTIKHQLPWFNAELWHMIRRKKRLFKKAKKSKKPCDWNTYKNYDKTGKKALNEAHGRYLDSIFIDALAEGNNRPFWS